MATKEAFVTIKDHKDNFEVNPTCRLINLAKIKSILITLTQKLEMILACSNEKSVIDWFKNIENKRRFSFISFDIL
jgi:hypothetical protein